MAITETQSQMETLFERSARVFEEMYHNRARGGLILTNERGEVLVLKDAINGKWSFPKGAIELCDCGDILKTAERETREECGLLRGRDYTLYSERFMKHYNATYFIAEAKPGAAERMSLNSDEFLGFAWICPERCEIPFTELNAGVRHFLKKWV